ncbi:MAG: flippase [Chloroflexi bacterium]|nr:MAG: flippase [Chloroflexota bacterium]MBL1193698.1 flippase [Chloroflexota bacterium]NOH10991.1 flippase [Chloroflexota bacterium]
MSSQIKQLAGNSAWLLLARVSSQGLGFIFAVLLARFLGEKGLGQYSFITTSIFLGNTVSSFGMDTLLIREIARREKVDRQLIGNAIWLQVGISIIYIVVLQSLANQLPFSTTEAITAIRVYSLALIPLAFFSVFSAILRGAERMDLFFLMNLGGAVFQIGLGIIILLNGAGILAIASLLLLTHFLSAILAGWLSRRYTKDFAIDWGITKNKIIDFSRQCLPFAALAVVGLLLQRMGIFSLSFIASERETGIYSAALRIIEGSKLIHFAFLGALLPRLATLQGNHDRKESMRQLGGSGFWFLFVTGVAIALLITVTAPNIIKWLYGEEFRAAILVLQIGIWVLLPYAWTAKQSVQLVATGHECKVVWAHTVTFVAALVIYPTLVLKLAGAGAALALVATELILAIVFLASGSSSNNPFHTKLST